MKAGFYCTDITPALGMQQPGGYLRSVNKAFHDPLKMRAAVFDDGEGTVALVGVDSCTIPARLASDVRAAVRERCGILENHVLMAASHTHSGGPLFGLFPETVADAPELIRTLVREYSTSIDPLYYQWAAGQAVTAVCEAYRRRVPCSLSVGSGFEDRAPINRRYRMKNGRVFTHPGKGNPDILEPAGPIDPEVGVVSAWDETGNLLGCVVNFACHGTTMSGAVSADWIFYLEQTVQAVMGNNASVVFLNGASGDITQVENRFVRESEFGERWARLVGGRVGAEAVKVMLSAERGPCQPVRASGRVLRIRRRMPHREGLERDRRMVEQGLQEKCFTTEWIFAKERLLADYLFRERPEADVEIQAIQIGPAVFLANPTELFCSLGLRIKKASAFALTCVVELANGYEGYVPDTAAFQPSGGGYETVLTSDSNLEVSAGDRIADASLDLIRDWKPGDMPTGKRPVLAKDAWPGGLWSYGVLGPDLGE